MTVLNSNKYSLPFNSFSNLPVVHIATFPTGKIQLELLYRILGISLPFILRL